MTAPSARDEIRATGLWSVVGKNYWSRRPVTRLDLTIGAYDDVASDEVPGFAERLVDALPGLVEHECSVGRRGGFVERLARGTYAPHIVEHVALELQVAAGDDVSYGRARGGDAPGAYVVAFAHRHAAVGRAAAAQALALVRDAFDGLPLSPAPAVDALRAARAEDDDPAPRGRVRVGVLGTRPADAPDAADVVWVTPTDLVTRGLPYAQSDVAVVLDDGDLWASVPAAFRAPERTLQLLTTMIDGLAAGGRYVGPADVSAAYAPALAAYARERGHRVDTFSFATV